MINDTLQQTVGAMAPSPAQRFVEGRVHGVTAAGVTFTVPSWDDGRHVFGPAPLAAAAIPSGAHTHPPDPSGGLPLGPNHTHLSPPIEDMEFETEEALDHVHEIEHRHPAPVPRPGFRCLVVLLGTGVDRPWVLGWWPA